MPGETFEPFTVVVAPFPFTGGPAARRRPALVISSRTFNDAHDQVLLAMITAAGGEDWPGDIPIRGWREAGLPAPCRMRLKVFTLDKSLIVRRLGGLGTGDRRAVAMSLMDSLATR